MYSKALLVLALSLLVAQCAAGPVGFILTYGACQTACNAAYVTCCTAAGTTAGTFTLGLGIPAALAGCSVIQGVCMAGCATAAAAAPTP
ncbi:unnamed protein product [Acanthoscelides obtectus]|uniref:Zygote-specific protein n=1 Tax=Acanthoscelides obtectus TaxID=200917 RepID=A0A9P0NX67_ACAOB|nr:unnamed protein product [Acanthoscelides obtectus]CAK1632050.1 hypothetical protein AOBTE_LOCUS7329 [Acanthoscelides obtectus]